MKNLKLLSVISIIALVTCLFLPCVSAKTKTKIAISDKKISIEVGEEYQLSVTGTKKSVTWSSSDKSVATVSSDGLVTAVDVGKVKVTGKIGTKKYSCQVSVKTSTKTTLTMANDVYARNFVAWAGSVMDTISIDEDDDIIELVIELESYDETVSSIKEAIEKGIPQILERGDIKDIKADESLMNYTLYYNSEETYPDGRIIKSTLLESKNRDTVLSFIAADVFHYAYLTGHTIDDITLNFIDNVVNKSLDNGTTNFTGGIKNLKWLIDEDL